ncbi:signal recognition particle, SRP19 subunit [Rhizopus microsporus var. microsporus]|uniref:Signal recognition particle, SRP19 subunit n=2 Tax=Rhizopus microsporus TaxID=58291 RepID=A0A2G4SJ08_RHIZD|nr:signal recognition particle, SRP19 subunit [Rhizopus microsporus ATCC 52813]ORE06872.1 signal recognition particle, SRP19 subunit [Rhizopus microsporus var. microsporus]PHZ08739.1 signal recognition particle, SRP19 subunit [Rhizopus microsporus ATCC 52813]
MSMLNKLKQTQKNPVFLDENEDMDVDNMDFPLPTESSSSTPAGMPNFAELQKMMQNMSTGAAPTPAPESDHIAVATGPQGVRRLSPEEYKDWICVYPCYIDADKSVQEGRKIAKEKAVSNPHAYHMALAVQRFGLTVVYENKCHPRDWANVGRVRVQLKTNDRFYCNSKITSRKQLFLAIAEVLPAVQKESSLPKTITSPLTTLEDVDEQRKAQGLPTLSEMQANNPLVPQLPAKPKKQKIKYVRA